MLEASRRHFAPRMAAGEITGGLHSQAYISQEYMADCFDGKGKLRSGKKLASHGRFRPVASIDLDEPQAPSHHRQALA